MATALPDITATDLNDTLEYAEPDLIDEGRNESEMIDVEICESDLDISDSEITELETKEQSEFIFVGANKKKRKQVSSNRQNEKNKREHLNGSDEEQLQLNRMKMSKANEDEQFVIIAKSNEVNIAKANPIHISRSLKDLIGTVIKIYNQTDSLKIICNKNQARILKHENKLGKYQCSFTILEQKEAPNKTKGITFGIDLNIPIEEIESEINDPIKIVDKIYRLKKYDKEKKMKIETTTVIIEYNNNIQAQLPTFMYLGYQKFTIKKFIPYPTRCYNCQMFGHTAANCRSRKKCSYCAENHNYQECSKKEEENKQKCANCGQDHSAAYKGCEVFKKAKQITTISKTEQISYSDAIKKYKQQTETIQIAPQTGNFQIDNSSPQPPTYVQPTSTYVPPTTAIPTTSIPVNNKRNDIDEKKIINNVMGEIKQQQEKEQEQIIKKITENISNANKNNKEDIVEEITQKTQTRCKCKIPLEGLVAFIIRTIKYYKNEQFLQKSIMKQILLITNVFEKYTGNALNNTMLNQLLIS
jgi:hypothetical protein